MRKGFTFIEIMVTLGVLASTLLVINQVVASSIQQVKFSKNLFYVDTVVNEALSHMNYIMKANELRYGAENFEECKMTTLEAELAADCSNLEKYSGRYVLVVSGAFDQDQRWEMVKRDGVDIVDDLENPKEFVGKYQAFEVYEKKLKNGGVVYTNIGSTNDIRSSAFSPLGYYRYVDVYDNGDFMVTVVYVDEINNLKVVQSKFLGVQL